jgi:hypothetical protein
MVFLIEFHHFGLSEGTLKNDGCSIPGGKYPSGDVGLERVYPLNEIIQGRSRQL